LTQTLDASRSVEGGSLVVGSLYPDRGSPDPALYGSALWRPTAVLDWRARRVCSLCRGGQADMVATGTRR
jgi:hypothetical protein